MTRTAHYFWGQMLLSGLMDISYMHYLYLMWVYSMGRADEEHLP